LEKYTRLWREARIDLLCITLPRYVLVKVLNHATVFALTFFFEVTVDAIITLIKKILRADITGLLSAFVLILCLGRDAEVDEGGKNTCLTFEFGEVLPTICHRLKVTLGTRETKIT
jgi:hypothetical protein